MRTEFVHKYKSSHSTKRKRYKKLLKKGHVKLIATYSDGWRYELINTEIER